MHRLGGKAQIWSRLIQFAICAGQWLCQDRPSGKIGLSRSVMLRLAFTASLAGPVKEVLEILGTSYTSHGSGTGADILNHLQNRHFKQVVAQDAMSHVAQTL